MGNTEGNTHSKCTPETGITRQDLCLESRAMATAYDIHEHGYEDERFEHAISENFHCAICTNVFKDPAMCCRNEHIYCRSCITEYLAKSQKCPTCMEPLTVDTLRVPPRIVLGCLSEFKIRCDFYNRGCRQIVELGKLERHVKECEFVPVLCSNEGCQVEVNARDKIHHETAVCEMRRVQCHNCAALKQEMETVNKQLTAVNKKLDGIEADNKEIKQNLNIVVQQLGLGKISKAASCEASGTQNEATTGAKANRGIIVVAGGFRSGFFERALNSVEMFDIAKGIWTMLQPMKESRKGASLVVYNNQIIVSGGHRKSGTLKSMETLPTDQLTQSVTWNEFPAVLPVRTHGHSSVVYNNQLITVGGYTLCDSDSYDITKSISEVSLTPPYSLKQLAYMRYKRMSLGVHLFGDKLVVVGGETIYNALDSVLLYDLAKNESKELAPLPYPVSEMATVSWNENIMIMGGAGFWSVFPCRSLQVLDSVLIYNIRTQKSRMLPKMKYKRRSACAVMIGKSVYVMGGVNENNIDLKSVECFNIERNSWKELPSMNEARDHATAVAF